jgi:Leucine-rich repeat (LRR) protein|tara:strand:- start:715 stop:1143 length:429 start_codon:yes stop_codon:yes gene_type:complete
MKILILFSLLMTLFACDRYQVTLNDRELYRPPIIFTDYAISDAALRDCVGQAIVDEAIGEPEQLEQLNCSYAGISNLSGLGRFSQLKSINLSNNNLRNLRPLMFFGSLETLNLANNSELFCIELDTLETLVIKELIRPEICR